MIGGFPGLLDLEHGPPSPSWDDHEMGRFPGQFYREAWDSQDNWTGRHLPSSPSHDEQG